MICYTGNMTVIDEYFKNVPDSQKAALEHVRSIIKQSAPDAEEVISYGMPAFKQDTKYLIGFGAFKHHLSIFPTSDPMVHSIPELQSFRTSKGTLQFTEIHPIPDAIIKQIVTHRLASIVNE
jgi:uncharacterized protein YdhG (YjbR/CyaY superfamily)